jgi:uncharacterized protein (TIGR02001 family)
MRLHDILRRFPLVAVAAAALPAPPAAAADIGGGLSVSGNASLVSDYRFRGISQTDRRFALQGGLTLAHESGFYATLWGSSIDDYVANGGDQEIDIVAGWRHAWGGTTIDAGLLYYYYPGSGGANTDFVEPYVSISRAFGPVTAKVSANYAPRQAALTIGAGDEDNLYLAGDLSVPLGAGGLAASAHLGHSFGPCYLTIGDGYTDWTVGLTYTRGPLTLGVSYVDTDGDFITPGGRNASGAGVVGTIGVAF